jgi:CRISPR-associated protein Cas1
MVRGISSVSVGKRKTIDFSKPNYAVERHDADEIRKKILSISYFEWKKLLPISFCQA